MNTNTEVDELLCYIKEVFAGVCLDGGISLREAMKIDGFGEESEIIVVDSSVDVGDSWLRINNSILESYPVLAHLDSKGFRYYLPATMYSLLQVKNPRSNCFYQLLVLLNPLKNSELEEMYTLLSDNQRRAVARFLKLLPSVMLMRVEHQTEITEMLNGYWNRWA